MPRANPTNHVAEMRSYYAYHAPEHGSQPPYIMEDLDNLIDGIIKAESTSEPSSRTEGTGSAKEVKRSCNARLAFYKDTEHDAKRNVYTCNYCSTAFESQKEIRNHIKWTCSVVHKKNREGLVNPRLPSMDDSTFTCSFCGESFEIEERLQEHVKVHGSPNKQFFCDVCGEGFRLKFNLETHLMYTHGQGKTTFTGGATRSMSAIGDSAVAASSEFRCEERRETSSSNFGIDYRHYERPISKASSVGDYAGTERFKHAFLGSSGGTDKSEQNDPQSDPSLSSKSRIGPSTFGHRCGRSMSPGVDRAWRGGTEHPHTDFSEPPAERRCSGKFEYSTIVPEVGIKEVDPNMREDLGPSTSACSFLGKASDARQPGPPLHYSCRVCGCPFSDASDLSTHLLEHTRPWACAFCPKRFKGKGSLNSHEKLHVDQSRPFPCDFCDKKFKTKGHAKTHMGLHTSSEKPFSCHFCHKRFRTKGQLKTHTKKHSGCSFSDFSQSVSDFLQSGEEGSLTVQVAKRKHTPRVGRPRKKTVVTELKMDGARDFSDGLKDFSQSVEALQRSALKGVSDMLTSRNSGSDFSLNIRDLSRSVEEHFATQRAAFRGYTEAMSRLDNRNSVRDFSQTVRDFSQSTLKEHGEAASANYIGEGNSQRDNKSCVSDFSPVVRNLSFNLDERIAADRADVKNHFREEMLNGAQHFSRSVEERLLFDRGALREKEEVKYTGEEGCEGLRDFSRGREERVSLSYRELRESREKYDGGEDRS